MMAKSAEERRARRDSRQGRELTGGYIASGLIFAGITALWAFIVRDDPYYRLTDLFGARVPAMLIAYLALMPLAGFFVGRWRYDRGAGGLGRFAAKLGARALHFTYAHSLIVLFTAAMIAETWFGLNLDDQVRSIDDRLFDLAARFAPWLAAYLTGYNFGRATVVGAAAPAPAPARDAPAFIDAPAADDAIEPAGDSPLRADGGRRAEPRFPDAGPERSERTPRPRQSASGLAMPAPEAQTQGFLPPQDLNRLRPSFERLR
jgi:hypothetical protein